MKRKKKNKIMEKIRREIELSQYGKLVSLRPSVAHKSKKIYSRQEKHHEQIKADD